MPNQPLSPLPALLMSTALSLSGAAWTTPALADLTRVGVAGAVNPATASTQPDGNKRTLVIGNDVVFKERITTDAGGKAQLLFLDRSALSVGPNAELTIDEFVFDPATGRGKLAVNAAVGVFRFVGGKLSKTGDVEIRTPSAVTGIRGGIAIIEVSRDGSTTATLVFGRQLTVTATNGTQQVIQKPGFAVTVAPASAASTQARPAAGTINRQLDSLEAAPRQGASTTPAQAAPTGTSPTQPPTTGAPAPAAGATTQASISATQITAGAVESRLAPAAATGTAGGSAVTVSRPASTTTPIARTVAGPTTLSTSPLTPTTSTTAVTVPRLPPPPPISTIRPATTTVAPPPPPITTTPVLPPPPPPVTVSPPPVTTTSPPPVTSSPPPPSPPTIPGPSKPGEPPRPTPPV